MGSERTIQTAATECGWWVAHLVCTHATTREIEAPPLRDSTTSSLISAMDAGVVSSSLLDELRHPVPEEVTEVLSRLLPPLLMILTTDDVTGPPELTHRYSLLRRGGWDNATTNVMLAIVHRACPRLRVEWMVGVVKHIGMLLIQPTEPDVCYSYNMSSCMYGGLTAVQTSLSTIVVSPIHMHRLATSASDVCTMLCRISNSPNRSPIGPLFPIIFHHAARLLSELHTKYFAIGPNIVSE